MPERFQGWASAKAAGLRPGRGDRRASARTAQQNSGFGPDGVRAEVCVKPRFASGADLVRGLGDFFGRPGGVGVPEPSSDGTETPETATTSSEGTAGSQTGGFSSESPMEFKAGGIPSGVPGVLEGRWTDERVSARLWENRGRRRSRPLAESDAGFRRRCPLRRKFLREWRSKGAGFPQTE